MIPNNHLYEAETLAADILNLSRNTLTVHLPFLLPALCALDFKPDPDTALATDGSFIYYQFYHILRSYKLQKESVMRDYLHTVLHCIYHHPFVGKRVEPDLWNLACDIAVEAIITELHLPDTVCSRVSGQADILRMLEGKISFLSAEAVYHYLKTVKWDLETICTMRDPFLADDHQFWYELTEFPDEQEKKPDDLSDSSSDCEQQNKEKAEDVQENHQEHREEDSDACPRPSPDTDQLKKQWQQIASRIQAELETASGHWGKKAGSMLSSLHLLTREKIDYTAFLRQFASLGEEILVNDEEFDYIFYTYGLKLYDNMPLVEPLEYKEVMKIKEFVIAIDTSASVRGELVESFIQKTCQLLLQENTWFSSVRIHVLQCDSVLQSDTLITCQEELETFINHLEVKGFGGTDFRPVFSYVEKLQANQQLANLKGLLYFTDGDGIYPDKQPPYKTAFLFPDCSQYIPSVPVWAIKVILDDDFI